MSAGSVKKEQKHKMITFSIGLSWKENYNGERNSSEEENEYLTDMSEETQGWLSSALKPRRQLHKRKGIPRRSPLC